VPCLHRRRFEVVANNTVQITALRAGSVLSRFDGSRERGLLKALRAKVCEADFEFVFHRDRFLTAL
jgi:hypothetical protein